MISYVTADVVYPVSAEPIRNGVIGFDESGKICSLLTASQASGLKSVKYYEGVIVPGFVNTHCHLELSHLRAAIPMETGLTGFITEILRLREADKENIIKAMELADQEMYRNGIVAVGDISNQLSSREVKINSKIFYHTFIEVFGFNRPSEPIIEQALKLREQFLPLIASIVPHAPYSVSEELFTAIQSVWRQGDIQSIHNQETRGENELFETATGEFAEFFESLGIAKTKRHGAGQNSIHYHLPLLKAQTNTLLVHNTFTSKADIDYAIATQPDLYFCFCPLANQYIEGALPDIELFRSKDVRITLGTDSLASNHQLNVLAEMQVLQQHSLASFQEILTWSTLNGATFLNQHEKLGSIDIGKTPGLNLLKLGADERISDLEVMKIC